MKKRNKIVDYITYIILRIVIFLFHLFPINLNLRTARFMGKLMWYIIGSDLPIIQKILRRKHREQMLNNLKLALGDKYSDEELEEIAKLSCQHLVMFAVECLFTTRLISISTWKQYVELKNFKEALKVLLENKGALLLT